jgi:glutamate 5-kinase
MSRTLVVKVGTSLLRGQHGLDTASFINSLAASLCAERQRGHGVALVTSGAVGLGCIELGLDQRPQLVEELQAAAAVGQGQLMGLYDRAFRPHGQRVAQVLLTRGDLASRRRFQSASRTLQQLLTWGVLPIVNENDTLATEELRFGDNDTLSALVAVALRATELVLLTDVDRLYSGDPRHDASAKPIDEVRNLAELDELKAAASGGGQWGTGGMTTKLAAARIATASGIQVRLADGRDPLVLQELLAGQPHGTCFLPSPAPIPDRKRWLAHALVPEGNLRIDAGAEQALRQRGASLLAVGIRAVEGEFDRQAPVRILDAEGRELARGLCAYGSAELRDWLGLGSAEIAARNNGVGPGVVVHRDQLVVTAAPQTSPTIPPTT